MLGAHQDILKKCCCLTLLLIYLAVSLKVSLNGVDPIVKVRNALDTRVPPCEKVREQYIFRPPKQRDDRLLHNPSQDDSSLNLLAQPLRQAGGRLNMKMLSYQYRDPHVKDKTVLRPSYL